jgi:prepilin-type N-terminal cleavage/methylation domain-containing protein/prepilin-type processing-associated H-X9-DG protein
MTPHKEIGKFGSWEIGSWEIGSWGVERRVMTRSRGSGGWTLVELLVVVSILAVLAGILFPVFARARERATRTACASNLRQMGLAMQLYVSDWDGMLPSISHDITEDPYSWTQTLIRLMKTPEALWCPNDPHLGDRSIRQSSYAVNNLLSSGALLSEVSDPAGTIYAGEAGLLLVGDHYHPMKGVRELMRELDGARHGKGSNYLYLDQHVRWDPFEATLHPIHRHLIQTGNENPMR